VNKIYAKMDVSRDADTAQFGGFLAACSESVSLFAGGGGSAIVWASLILSVGLLGGTIFPFVMLHLENRWEYFRALFGGAWISTTGAVVAWAITKDPWMALAASCVGAVLSPAIVTSPRKFMNEVNKAIRSLRGTNDSHEK
jgi:hypothetical protein